MSKLIPILYQPDMVRAKLELRKNQTRRLVKPQPNENGASYMANAPLDWESIYKEEWKPWKWETETGESIVKHCPYGNPGDILWTRENFYALGKWVKDGTTKTGKQKWKFEDMTLKMGRKYLYPYGSDKPATVEKKKDGLIHWYSRNSLFMPLEACRLFDKITAVRIERLHDITEEDAKAKGIEWINTKRGSGWRVYGVENQITQLAVVSYRSLWISINGE